MKTKIGILDDHPMTRLGYRTLLEDQRDMAVIFDAASATEALDQIGRQAVDVVLVDLSLKETNGIELIKQAVALKRNLRILVVSMHDEQLYAERALRAGARGYIMKTEAPSHLISAIKSIVAGDIYLSEPMKRQFLRFYSGHGKVRGPSNEETRLGDRELEVFENIGKGMSTKQIADAMNISPKTVDTYRGRIKAKLGIESGSELIRRAVLWVSRTQEMVE